VKIVFWGTPEFAAKNLSSILSAGFDVVGVVTQPDRRRGRGKNLSPSEVKDVAIKNKLPVFTTHSISKDKDSREKILKLKADIYIVVAFGQILPREVLEKPALGCWNSHASLLPKWRGAAPIQWSILNGDQTTGVCIMSMEEGLDTGPIINQEIVSIKDSNTLVTLTNKLSEISSKLLIKSLIQLEDTFELSNQQRLNKLNAIDQSSLNIEPTYARQINKFDYLIDWFQDSIIISNKIRGLFPNAYTIINKKRVKISEISIIDKVEDLLKYEINYENILGIEPSTIITVDKNIGILIMSKDKPIIINRAQVEGKIPTDGYTMAQQTKIYINQKL
tara:strand:+ start:1910 stop:2911 length:1002 start_codon:yes stop_codon:yes gene_type:complete